MIIKLRNAYSFHQLGCRDNQEDSRFPNCNTANVRKCKGYAVCDGVGGEANGELASRIVAQSIGNYLSDYDYSQSFTQQSVAECLADAYNALDAASTPTNKGMGTTMAMVAFHQGGVTGAHIGDSRIYHIRPGRGIIYRSEDHSLVNAYLRNGLITPQEALNHPQRNVITRCMTTTGNHSRAKASMATITDVRAGDVFILASDGVLCNVTDGKMCEIINLDISEEEKIKRLAAMCKNSNDNNTMWMITVESVEEVSPTNIYTTEVSAASYRSIPVKKSLLNQLTSLFKIN